METMSGVEFDCMENDIDCHIVGLDFRADSPDMAAFIKALCDYRNTHTRKQFEAAVEKGIFSNVTWQDVIDYNPGAEWFCNDRVYKALHGISREDFDAIAMRKL